MWGLGLRVIGDWGLGLQFSLEGQGSLLFMGAELHNP